MPKYRALHTKIIDSFDFNEMPDDFTRCSWMLLTLVVDSEGRGIDSAAWVRSKMYPMREDVTIDQMRAAMDWFVVRSMIVRYSVAGKNYFYIPTFGSYQPSTDKEAKSTLPAPEPLRTYSEPTPNLLPSKVALNAYAYADSDSDSNADAYADAGAWSADAPPPPDAADPLDLEHLTPRQAQKIPEIATFLRATGRMPGRPTYRTVIDAIRGRSLSVDCLQTYWREWNNRGYNPANLAWLTEWATVGEIPPKINGKSTAPPSSTNPIRSAIEQAKELLAHEQKQ